MGKIHKQNDHIVVGAYHGNLPHGKNFGIKAAVLQAATPSAKINYSRPAIAIDRRPVTSRAPLHAPHNASCVYTERANKSAYHLQPSINCVGEYPPTL
jgi:hypothetical protein